MQRCIRIIFYSNPDPEKLADFINVVHIETAKPGLAPSNTHVLVELCSTLLQVLYRTRNWEKWGLEIVVCNAQALELCLGGTSRPQVKRSARVATWRGLRTIFSDGATQEKIIREAVKKLSYNGSQPSAKYSIMLGAIASVCARQSKAKKILSTQKSEIFSFYNREIIGSRIPMPTHIANGLADFFLAFITEEDLKTEVVPSLEKALLRAPEIVLNDLVTSLFRSLPNSVDLSAILRTNLLKPLLSHIRSTNPVLRQGALSAFTAAMPLCNEAESIVKISEDILTPLKSGKTLSADQKVFHSEMLGVVPATNTTAKMMVPALAGIAANETNDAVLSAVTSALLHYMEWEVHNDGVLGKPIVNAFVKGIEDKRVPLRRLWTIRLGDLLWSIDPGELQYKYSAFVESSIPALTEMWNEINTNPINAVQSGLVTSAFVFTAIAREKLSAVTSSKVNAALTKAQIARQALSTEPKPSFLLNPRIFGKLSTDDDFKWFIRALSSLSTELASLKPDSAVVLAWSQAIMFCICSLTVSPSIRKIALEALSRMLIRNPTHLSNVVAAGIWHWRNSIESGEKDSVAFMAKTKNQNLHVLFKAICLTPAEAAHFGGVIDEFVRKGQMITMFVLSRPELVPRISWIELCLRVKIDPGDLARTSGDLLIQQILDLTEFNEKVNCPPILRNLLC